MKLKKVVSLILALTLCLSLAACGKNDTSTNAKNDTKKDTTQSTKGNEDNADGTISAELSGRLVVWTLANDLKYFADRFM